MRGNLRKNTKNPRDISQNPFFSPHREDFGGLAQ